MSWPLHQINSGWFAPVERFARAAYRFVFPPACPLCSSEMASLSTSFENRGVTPILCPDCVQAITPIRSNACQLCGLPLGPYVASDAGCPNCRPRGFRFARVVRFGLYDGPLRDAIIRGKSPHGQPVSAALANQFWMAQHDRLVAEDVDLVVPVPRYWTRRLWHDHNQAETLARVLARQLRVRFGRTLLHKMKLTPDQSDLSAVDRKRNLKNAFSVWFGRRLLNGKTVLLVDDILTTGTTADECARALLHAGASRVVVAVIAVVPPPSR